MVEPDQAAVERFNTQPPEGGWLITHEAFRYNFGFNTQPPEGGWHFCVFWINHG